MRKQINIGRVKGSMWYTGENFSIVENPLEGDLFLNTNELKTYIYKNGEWVFDFHFPSVIEGYAKLKDENLKFYTTNEYSQEILPVIERIYIDLNNNKIYRWGGTQYVEISKSLALGETSSTAYEGSKGKENRQNIEEIKNTLNNKEEVGFDTYSEIGLGTPGGVATLNENGKLLTSQIPDNTFNTKLKVGMNLKGCTIYFNTNHVLKNEDFIEEDRAYYGINLNDYDNYYIRYDKATLSIILIHSSYYETAITIDTFAKNGEWLKSEYTFDENYDYYIDEIYNEDVFEKNLIITTSADYVEKYEFEIFKNQVADINFKKADLVNGKVPTIQLPSYVDDVLEYTTQTSFPATGESGKIYVDISKNKTYRWSGSIYVEIGSGISLGETSSTAYPGNLGSENRSDIEKITYSYPNELKQDNEINLEFQQGALDAYNGSETNSQVRIRSDYIDIEKNIKITWLSGTTQAAWYRVYDENKVFIGNVEFNSSGNVSKKETTEANRNNANLTNITTVIPNAKYVRLVIRYDTQKNILPSESDAIAYEEILKKGKLDNIYLSKNGTALQSKTLEPFKPSTNPGTTKIGWYLKIGTWKVPYTKSWLNLGISLYITEREELGSAGILKAHFRTGTTANGPNNMYNLSWVASNNPGIITYITQDVEGNETTDAEYSLYINITRQYSRYTIVMLEPNDYFKYSFGTEPLVENLTNVKAQSTVGDSINYNSIYDVRNYLEKQSYDNNNIQFWNWLPTNIKDKYVFDMHPILIDSTINAHKITLDTTTLIGQRFSLIRRWGFETTNEGKEIYIQLYGYNAYMPVIMENENGEYGYWDIVNSCTFPTQGNVENAYLELWLPVGWQITFKDGVIYVSTIKYNAEW